MHRTLHPTAEFFLELTAQELLDPPPAAGLIEIDDICRIDTLDMAAMPANTAPAVVAIDEDSIEIELTSAEIDALLEGRWPT